MLACAVSTIDNRTHPKVEQLGWRVQPEDKAAHALMEKVCLPHRQCCPLYLHVGFVHGGPESRLGTWEPVIMPTRGQIYAKQPTKLPKCKQAPVDKDLDVFLLDKSTKPLKPLRMAKVVQRHKWFELVPVVSRCARLYWFANTPTVCSSPRCRESGPPRPCKYQRG